jgi:hypothetical protein
VASRRPSLASRDAKREIEETQSQVLGFGWRLGPQPTSENKNPQQNPPPKSRREPVTVLASPLESGPSEGAAGEPNAKTQFAKWESRPDIQRFPFPPRRKWVLDDMDPPVTAAWEQFPSPGRVHSPSLVGCHRVTIWQALCNVKDVPWPRQAKGRSQETDSDYESFSNKSKHTLQGLFPICSPRQRTTTSSKPDTDTVREHSRGSHLMGCFVWTFCLNMGS